MTLFFGRTIFNIMRSGWYSIAVLLVAPVYGFGSEQSVFTVFPFQLILIADFGLSVYAARYGKLPSMLYVLGFSIAGYAVIVWIFRDFLLDYFGGFSEPLFLLFSAMVLGGGVLFTESNGFDAIARSRGCILANLRVVDFFLLAGVLAVLLFSLLPLGAIGLVSVFFLYQPAQFLVLRRRNIVEIEPVDMSRMVGLLSTLGVFSIAVIFMLSGPRLDLALTYRSASSEMLGFYLDISEKIFVFFGMPLGVFLHFGHARQWFLIGRNVFWLAVCIFMLAAVISFIVFSLTHFLDDTDAIRVFAVAYAGLRVLLTAAFFDLNHYLRIPLSVNIGLVAYFAVIFFAKSFGAISLYFSVSLTLIGIGAVFFVILSHRSNVLHINENKSEP